MMEQAGVIRARVCVLAAVWMTAAYAQEEAQPAAADEQAPAAVQQEESAKTFMPMVRLVQVRGKCEVLNPDVGSYESAVENKVYPLGTRLVPVRTAWRLWCFRGKRARNSPAVRRFA